MRYHLTCGKLLSHRGNSCAFSHFKTTVKLGSQYCITFRPYRPIEDTCWSFVTADSWYSDALNLRSMDPRSSLSARDQWWRNSTLESCTSPSQDSRRYCKTFVSWQLVPGRRGRLSLIRPTELRCNLFGSGTVACTGLRQCSAWPMHSIWACVGHASADINRGTASFSLTHRLLTCS